MRLRFLILGIAFLLISTMIVLGGGTQVSKHVSFDLSDGTVKTVNLNYFSTIENGELFNLTLIEYFESNTLPSVGGVSHTYELNDLLTGDVFQPQMTILNDHLKFVWNIPLSEDKSFNLAYVDEINNDYINFYELIIRVISDITFQIKKPSIVNEGLDFQINVSYDSNETRNIFLEPAPLNEEIIKTTDYTKHIFTTNINETTFFKIRDSDKIISEFTVDVIPATKGTSCDSINPCSVGLVCFEGFCKTIEYVGEGEFCDNQIYVCNSNNLECSSESYCKLINPNDYCELDDECNEGFICVANSCQENNLSTNICASDSDCAFGLTCFEEQCVYIQHVHEGSYCNESENIFCMENFFCNSDYICECEDEYCIVTNATQNHNQNNTQNSLPPTTVGLGYSCDGINYICEEEAICLGGSCAYNPNYNETNNTDNETEEQEVIELSDKEISKENLLEVGDMRKSLKNSLGLNNFSDRVMPEKNDGIMLEKDTDSQIILNENKAKIIETKIETKKEVGKILRKNGFEIKDITESEKLAKSEAIITKKISQVKKESEGEVSTKTTIEVKTKGFQEDVYIIEVIPKEVAMSAKDLVYNIKPIILEDDPIIMWHLENVTDNVNLSYRTMKNVSVTGNTILIAENLESGFDLTNLLPLILIPLFAGLIVMYSKFKERNREEE